MSGKPFYERYPRTARVMRGALRLVVDYSMQPRAGLVKWLALACGVKYLFGL